MENRTANPVRSCGPEDQRAASPGYTSGDSKRSSPPLLRDPAGRKRKKESTGHGRVPTRTGPQHQARRAPASGSAHGPFERTSAARSGGIRVAEIGRSPADTKAAAQPRYGPWGK